jgi:hypothetical protein
MQELIGKEILDARFKDRSEIVLNLRDNTSVILSPYGDCCANCYINHIDNALALFSSTVLKVEDLELTSEGDDDYGNVTESWGHRIITDKGICTIDMRVEHNGYYGGSLECINGDCHSESPLLSDF